MRFGTEAPLEAFGGGQSAANVVGAVQRGLGLAEKHFEEEKQKADDIAVQDAYAKTGMLRMDLEAQAKQRRGQDAFGVTEEYTGQFDKGVQEIQDSLTTSQQQMFHKIRNNQRLELFGNLENHAANERVRFADEKYQSTMKVLHDEAVGAMDNPQRFDEKLRLQDAIVDRNAQILGKSAVWAENQKAEARSKVYSVSMQQLLAQRRDADAQVFFKKYGSQITDEDSRLKIQEGMGQITALNKAQYLKDVIIAKTKNPLEQYNLSIELTKNDPRAQDKVQELLREYNTAQKDAKELDGKIAAEQTFKLMKQGMRFDDVPEPLKMRLTEERYKSLQAFDKHRDDAKIAKESPIEYRRLMMKASTDPNAFLKEDIASNTHLTDAARSQLLTLQSKTLDHIQGAGDGFAHRERILDSVFDRARVFDPGERAKVSELIRNKFTEAFKNNPKASDKDFEDIAHSVIDPAVRAGRVIPTPRKVPKPPAAPTFSKQTVDIVLEESGIKKSTNTEPAVRAAVRQYWEINTARTKRNMDEADLAELTRLMATKVKVKTGWFDLKLDQSKRAGTLTLDDFPNAFIEAYRQDKKAKGQPTDNKSILSMLRIDAAKGNLPKQLQIEKVE